MTDRPHSVALGDVDGDGRLDVVSANLRSDTLTIFRQESGGEFTLLRSLGGPGAIDGPQSVALGDVDGDGQLDVVSANWLSHTLTIFRQESGGEFVLLPPLGGPGVIESPRSVALGDVDGDGRLDVVSANEFSDTLTIFRQESGGEFELLLPLDSDSPRSVALGDVDGDGHVDVVSANYSGNTVTIFRQEAGGEFEPLRPLGGPGVTEDPRAVALGDVDGDGRLDVVSANHFSNTLTIFRQESSGGFALLQSLGGPGSTVALGDLDGDGRLDVVSANRIFRQESGGEFVLLQSLGVAGVSVALGDVDGDGRLDVVYASSNTLIILRQESDGEFTLLQSLGGFGVTSRPTSVALGDVDGDGRLDVVSANSSSNTLTIFRQESDGEFTLLQSLGGFGVTSLPKSVALGDVDGDGRLDVVSANWISDTLTIFRQESDGEFTFLQSLGGPGVISRPTSVALGDVDGDGQLDVVSANQTSNTLTIFRQESGGEFTLLQSLDGFGVGSPQSVALGDVDGDGRLDVVSANETSDTLSIFLGGR